MKRAPGAWNPSPPFARMRGRFQAPDAVLFDSLPKCSRGQRADLETRVVARSGPTALTSAAVPAQPSTVQSFQPLRPILWRHATVRPLSLSIPHHRSDVVTLEEGNRPAAVLPLRRPLRKRCSPAGRLRHSSPRVIQMNSAVRTTLGLAACLARCAQII